MYKFMQKNRKKLLAIFAVGLMVVFIIPPMANESIGGTRDTAFYLGDESVSMQEARHARDQWVTLIDSLRGMPPQILQNILGDVILIADDMQEHPELFLLLQREAASQGLRATDEQVEEFQNLLTRIASLFGGGGVRDAAALREAVRELLAVRALFERVGSGMKTSQAMVTRELAKTGQRVKLDLVHYSTEDFAKDVPAPTPEQLQKHFDAYKDKLPGSPTEQNPFGFGYLVPAQVKLNYLTLPAEEVARKVRGVKGDLARGVKHDETYFEWAMKAELHYRANPDRYPASEPATRPTTATQPGSAVDDAVAAVIGAGGGDSPAEAPAAAATTNPTTTGPSTGPTTRGITPEQEAEIIEELIKPQVDRRIDEIAAAVAERMKADFEAAQRNSAGAPEDFGSAAYLQRVRDDVQKRHDVQLGVSEINESKTQAGLRELKGIGQSFLESESFPQYVMRWAAPFAAAADKGAAEVLSINEPSRPFRDFDGNVYVFQLREATPSRPPADMGAVKDKVEADLRTALGFEAATAAAKKLHAAPGRLAAAAGEAGKDVFTTPQFFNRQGSVVDPRAAAAADPAAQVPQPVDLLPGVSLPAAARDQLVEAAFELLERGTPDKRHPREVVPLPAAGRVVVAELADVERQWQDKDDDLLRQQVARELAAGRASRVLEEYFKPDAVRQRLAYRNPNEAPPTPAAAPAQ